MPDNDNIAATTAVGMDTTYLNRTAREYLESYLASNETSTVEPQLFVCFEHEIMEFPLSGHQTLGRPVPGHLPDIPVVNKYVSRDHGYFDTTPEGISYTASDTKNGIIFRRKLLAPGETVDLWDGDELIIPTFAGGKGADIMLVCARVEGRINIWRELELAARDALTGLSGRNTFKTWYLQNHGFTHQKELSLFILDIDHFKRINDVYGHSTGDAALKTLAEAMVKMIGGKGYVCRWGGDEFVGIIEKNGQAAKAALAEMGRQLHAVKIDNVFRMTISAGVVDINSAEGAEGIDELVMLADQAMYGVKESGRNRVCLYGEAS
ncbi:MAG: GGDEF domain-containing protein [Selenomonadaceae bacterium]|nr:GGDEF domain-containing protein [Selenomonadaceae bacterium]